MRVSSGGREDEASRTFSFGIPAGHPLSRFMPSIRSRPQWMSQCHAIVARRRIRPRKSGPRRQPLRPVYRPDPTLSLDAPGVVPEAWRVPLRAWYPIELFDCAGVLGAGAELAVADENLVLGYVLGGRPVSPVRPASWPLPVPDLVDDAASMPSSARCLGEASLAPLRPTSLTSNDDLRPSRQACGPGRNGC